MPHDLWDDPSGYYKTFATDLVIKVFDENLAAGTSTPNHGKSCWSRNGRDDGFWICQNQSALEFLIDHLLRMRADSHPRIAEFEQKVADQAEHVAEQMIIGLKTGGVYGNQSGPPRNISYFPPGGENTFKHGVDSPNATQVGSIDTDTPRHTSCNGLILAYMDDAIRALMTSSTTVLHAISLHIEWWCGLGFDGNVVDPPRIPGRNAGSRARDYFEPGFYYGQWHQIRMFALMHKLTDNREWLSQAKQWLDFHLKDANGRTTIQGGKSYTTWDTGRVGWKLGGTEMVNDGNGDLVNRAKGGTEIQFTEWNWYDGLCVYTLYLLIHEMKHDDTDYWQSEITKYEDIILKKTEWMAYENRVSTGPTGDMWTTELGAGVRTPTVHPVSKLNYTGDRDLINHKIQGGLKNTTASPEHYLLKSDAANIMTPSEWEALSATTTYGPLFGLQHHMPDGRYYQYFWDEGVFTDIRWHHQKRWEDQYYNSTVPALYQRFLNNLPQGPFSKNLSQDNFFMGNACWIRYQVLNGRSSCSDYSEDKLWAEWVIHDGWAFLGAGAVQALRSKSQRATAMGWSSGARALMFTLGNGMVAAGDVFGVGVKFMRYSGPTLPTNP